MKKSLPSFSDWHCNEMKRSPQHAPEYVDRRDAQLAVIDQLSPAEREFVTNAFNLGLALTLVRQYYGRLDEAREVLEQQRQALQVQRLASISIAGLRQ